MGRPSNFRRNAQRRYFFLEHSDDACNIFLSLFARRIQLMGYIEYASGFRYLSARSSNSHLNVLMPSLSARGA